MYLSSVRKAIFDRHFSYSACPSFRMLRKKREISVLDVFQNIGGICLKVQGASESQTVARVQESESNVIEKCPKFHSVIISGSSFLYFSNECRKHVSLEFVTISTNKS